MANVGWYPPLPSGWEARWDPNQKAYFYIDHVRKQTSWEDPRFKKPTQNQAAQALSPGGTSHHAHHRGQGHQGETIPMRDMQRQGHAGQAQQQDTGFSRVDNGQVQKVKALLPTCPDSVIKQTLLKNQNNYSLTVHELQAKGYTKDQPVMQLTNTPAAHLKELFPAATAGVIQDVLAMCSNNEDEAKDQLIDLGFEMARASGSTSRAVSPSHSPRHHESSGLSPHHTQSGQRRHSGNHSRQATSPHHTPKPQMSEAEKERMKSKLQVEFPNVGKDIISMALEATSYNEESTKKVLGGTYNSGHTSTTRVTSASSTTSATGRASSAAQYGPTRFSTNAGLEPVAFPEDRPESRPSSSQTSSSRETTPSQSHGSSQSRHGATLTQQQQKAKQVTKLSEQLLTTTNDMLNHLASSCCMREGGSQENASASVQSEDGSDRRRHARAKVSSTTTGSRQVVTAQPKIYTSPYRTQANGPNPQLRNGPDRSLLLSDYTTAQGPNPALRSGPDPSRVQGSQGAQGPDPSLRCGPQSGLHLGPSLENLSVRHDLSIGSGVLVTAI